MTTIEAPRFPMRRQCQFEPPREYAELRAQAPISRVRLWDGREAWLLTRYEDVRQFLSDRRAGAIPTRPGFPFLARLPFGGAKQSGVGRELSFSAIEECTREKSVSIELPT